MPRPRNEVPSIRAHISGQSIVTIDGKTFYLGKHNSPEAFARFAVLFADYQAGKLGEYAPEQNKARALAILNPSHCPPSTDQSNEPLTVRHLLAEFVRHVEKSYADNQQEISRAKLLEADICEHDGNVLAIDYGPRRLQAQRDRWIADKNKSRAYINRLVNLVWRAWKWGVAQELCTNESWQRLKAVEPLRMGRTSAKENKSRTPVSIDVVTKTAKELSPVLRDMVCLQVATGMRPSELCNLRPMDIDRTGETWFYDPATHKNLTKGKTRSIPLVGQAREIVENYLNRSKDSYCFSPSKSMAWFRAKQRSERKSKVQPSQQNRAKDNPRKQPGVKFDSSTYRKSIERAAKRAKVEPWTPYQIRHLSLTIVRDALGIEASAALAGHAKIDMTIAYTATAKKLSIEAAKVAPRIDLSNEQSH